MRQCQDGIGFLGIKKKEKCVSTSLFCLCASEAGIGFRHHAHAKARELILAPAVTLHEIG